MMYGILAPSDPKETLDSMSLINEGCSTIISHSSSTPPDVAQSPHKAQMPAYPDFKVVMLIIKEKPLLERVT